MEAAAQGQGAESEQRPSSDSGAAQVSRDEKPSQMEERRIWTSRTCTCRDRPQEGSRVPMELGAGTHKQRVKRQRDGERIE